MFGESQQVIKASKLDMKLQIKVSEKKFIVILKCTVNAITTVTFSSVS